MRLLEKGVFTVAASREDFIGSALERYPENDMFAVFQSGGKQHRVSEGDVVKLELLTAELGEEVVFDKVLLVVQW